MGRAGQGGVIVVAVRRLVRRRASWDDESDVCSWVVVVSGRGVRGKRVRGGVSLIVERALLPGHGLDGARHGRRLERGRSVGVQGVADGVDGGEGPLGGQRERVLVLRLQ